MSERDKSILLRLAEEGQNAPRVLLAGSDAAEPAVAETSERYQIVGEIARGGVGVVYKGRDADLGRDVAIKLLRDDHLNRPEMIQRFVEEAQVGGQLQHPGIVPVYELGMKDGGRPYFAMKLVKGRTLTELLSERKDATQDRRALLAHFHQVCQTLAYAHSRGVIHRDLKPSNIMIGSFGEVQVVDWGFAKVLHRGGIADERRAKRDVTVVATVRTATEGSESVAGAVMGTPSYMPPEQALGRVEDLTERADVFSLGAILCEILTGAPAYVGTSGEIYTAASHAHLDDAYARLDKSGADMQLASLARACLSPLPKDRPRSASEVADAVGRVLNEAEGRAHQAQLRAVRAAAQSEEQRRARRQTISVAAAVLTVVLLGGGAWFVNKRVEDQRNRERVTAIDAAILEASRLDAAADWPGARSAAEQALGLAADDSTRRREAEGVRDQIEEHADAARLAEDKAEQEAALLAKLDEIALRRGDDFDATRADATYRAKLSDPAVLQDFDRKAELAQHFDAWVWLRRSFLKDSDWRPLDKTARNLDRNPWRNGLREAAANNDTAVLRKLAAEVDPAKQGARSLFQLGCTLARRDRAAGLALLRRANERYPGDFWLNMALMEFTAISRWSKRGTFEGYAASRDEMLKSAEYALTAMALRPESLSVRWALAHRLAYSGQFDAAIAELREMIRIRPKDATAHALIGFTLLRKGDFNGAVAPLREAIRINPGHASFPVNLGEALVRKGDFDGAIAAYREAIRIDPGDPGTHDNLGLAFADKGDFDRAIAAHREAIRIDPRYTLAHLNLGMAFMTSGDNANAIPAFRRATELDPKHVLAHRLLGGALSNDGQLDEAVVVLKKTLALDPNDAISYQFLGLTLSKKGDVAGAQAAMQRWRELTEEADSKRRAGK